MEKYLSQCVESVLAQSYQNFEILLIDDGSTDNSRVLANDYARRYPDIFAYIKWENKGLGGVRNTGLENVDTDYVFFFDGDDFMGNRAIESINQFINNLSEDVEGIFFNPVIFDWDAPSYQEWHDKSVLKKIFDGITIVNVKENPLLFETQASVCRSIWKTKFLKSIDLNFLEHRWEDVPPYFYIKYKANKTTFLDYDGAHFYRTNNDKQITVQVGKSRLHLKFILDIVKDYMNNDNWTLKEKRGVLSFLSNYFFWFLKVIEKTYRDELVEILHSFLRSFKRNIFTIFKGTQRFAFAINL